MGFFFCINYSTLNESDLFRLLRTFYRFQGKKISNFFLRVGSCKHGPHILRRDPGPGFLVVPHTHKQDLLIRR